jgi:DNA modification methylase
VLRDDGTLWLNLGDSYATGAGKVGEHPGGGEQGKRGKRIAPRTQPNRLPLDGLKRGDLVLDVFNGSGTTGVVALNLGRRYLGLELNHEYATKSRQRLAALQARLDARAERKATKAAKSRGAKA